MGRNTQTSRASLSRKSDPPSARSADGVHPTRAREDCALKFGLTPREAEIIHWISEGKRDREIALILGISTRTVHNHVHHILEKLGVETRTTAAKLAFETNNRPAASRPPRRPPSERHK